MVNFLIGPSQIYVSAYFGVHLRRIGYGAKRERERKCVKESDKNMGFNLLGYHREIERQKDKERREREKKIEEEMQRDSETKRQ